MKFLSFYYVPVFHELIVSWDCGNWEVGSNHNGFHVFGGWALNSRSPTLLFNDRTFSKDFNFSVWPRFPRSQLFIWICVRETTDFDFALPFIEYVFSYMLHLQTTQTAADLNKKKWIIKY